MGEFITKQETSVTPPSAGYLKLYPKNDGYWYSMDSSGTETKIGLGPHAVTHTDGSDQVANANTITAGLMSAVDKLKLDTLAGGNVVTPIRNETGGLLSKHKLIAVVGYSTPHSRPLVNLADKDNAALRPAIAILLEDVADETNSDALVVGTVTGMDTSLWSLTDQLVLGSSGALMRPPPDSDPFTGEVQNIGSVSRVDLSDGHMIISVDGLNPVTGQQVFALAGTAGSPSKTNLYVTDSDPRMTDTRTPTAHAASHVGADAIQDATAIQKGLMTSAYASKLDGIEAGAEANTVDSVFSRTGDVVALASDYDASQVDNDSGVSGSNVSNALDALDAAISAVSSGCSRRSAVIDYVDCTAAPPTEVTDDRYILDFTAGTVNAGWDGASKGDIVQFNGTTWDVEESGPEVGWVAYVKQELQDRLYVNGVTPDWEARPANTQLHADLTDVSEDQHHNRQHGLGSSADHSSATLSELNSLLSDATLGDASDAAPEDVTKATAVIGTSGDFAREDHKHDISTAAAGAATPGDTVSEGTASSLARSDHRHSLSAFGTGAGTFCEGDDSRLSDARTPTSHASSHDPGGGDAMAVDVVAGTGSLRTLGTGTQQACSGNDSRLSDSRTPTAHNTSHQSGGSDAIKLDDLEEPDDNADLDASTAKHGLMQKYPGGTTNFLRADGTFVEPPGGYPEFQFFGDQMEYPISTDWVVDDPAGGGADSNDPSLTVRRFDDTTEEGVGFPLMIPSGATNIKFTFLSRAEVAPGSAQGVALHLYEKDFPDNSAVPSWSSAHQLTALSMPANEYWQEDSQQLTLATLGLTAGRVTQFELARDTADGGDTLVGDWTLMMVKVEFS